MNREFRQFFSYLFYPFLLVASMWIIKIVELLTDSRYTRYGIYPREWDGFKGIFTGPFIHDDLGHLMSNSLPLLVLSSMMIIFYRRVALPSIVGIYITTGVLVWLFARTSYHIGASGVVYGLISFVFWSGIFRANSRSIILGLLVLIVYSGYFQGIKPEEGVSWESHLLGAFSGILFAFIFKNILEPEEVEEDRIHEPILKSYFLPRDIFEKTKYERWLESQVLEEEEEF